MRGQHRYGPAPYGASRGVPPSSLGGLESLSRMPLADFAVLPLILGFFVVYLNLDEVAAPGRGNQAEKGLLLIGAILVVLTRPIAPAKLYVTLALAAVPAISLIGTDFLYATSGRFIRGFISYMVPWLMMMVLLRERDAKLFMVALALAPIFSCCLGFLYETVGVWKMFHYSYDGANRLQGSTIPAFLAAGSALGAFAALAVARHYDQRYLFVVLANLAILALTGGRMALAIALLALGFFVLTRYRITTGLITQGVVAVGVMAVAAFVLFPDLIARLSHDDDSGRGMLWATVIRVWDAHPYFGIGLGHQGMIVPESVSKWVTTTAAHNEYIRLGSEIGWVGLTLLGLVYVAFMWVNSMHGPKQGDVLFPLMCVLFLLFSYADNALSQPTMFGLMVAALYERGLGVGRPARIPFSPNPFRRRPPEGWGPLA